MLPLDIATKDFEGHVAWLREQHHNAQPPVGQSLRRGTQTPGAILSYHSPHADNIRTAIRDAMIRYIAQLPPHDAAHPLLKHRDRMWRFVGSWSVRLQDAGHHVSHIHPQGHISSASYWVLPEAGECAASIETDCCEGWLEIGRPPEDLGLDLETIWFIRPEAGHLVLFPSTIYHGTTPFSHGERLTLAFDARFTDVV